jgi:hypothetical protein
MSEKTVAAGIEQAVKAYIRTCNDGDAETIAARFCLTQSIIFRPAQMVWSIDDRRQFLEESARAGSLLDRRYGAG